VRDDAKETGMAVVRESTRDAAKEQQRAPSTAHLKASKWAATKKSIFNEKKRRYKEKLRNAKENRKKKSANKKF
jgi:hypothetical protein